MKPIVDVSMIVGVVLAVLALVGTHFFDGGQVSLLFQPAAALIVVGGTVAAIAIQYPSGALRRTLVDLVGLLSPRPSARRREETIQLFVAMADYVQRHGSRAVLGVAQTLDHDADHLRGALELVGRQTKPQQVRDALEIEFERHERSAAPSIEVLRAAGGFAPTMGVLGAIFGLVRIMGDIEDPSQIGSGVALAFVATIYGLALANFALLPIAGRLQERLERKLDDMEIVVEGACSLACAEDPTLLEHKLRSYGQQRKSPEERAATRRR